MRKLVLTGFFIGSLAAPASAQVVLDRWGTFATIVSSDCADFCDPETDLSWLFGLTFGPTNGGAEIDLIDATLSNAKGDAFAEASVQAVLAPAVRVDATAAPGGWVDGTGTAVQGYTYVGVAPDTIDVSVQLTGTIGNPDADPSTGLAAEVSYVGNANVATLLFESAAQGSSPPTAPSSSSRPRPTRRTSRPPTRRPRFRRWAGRW
jgi:hypothetical protein